MSLASDTKPFILVKVPNHPPDPYALSRIWTHSGRFHCDEVMAISMLRLIGMEGPIKRTRNLPPVEERTGIFVDVGGLYDPQRHFFDHHQPSFMDPKENPLGPYYDERSKTEGIIMSSVGLVYKTCAENLFFDALLTLTDQSLDRTLERSRRDMIESPQGPFQLLFAQLTSQESLGEFYHRYIKCIDANDNGFSRIHPSADSLEIVSPEGERKKLMENGRYVTDRFEDPYSLPMIVGIMNRSHPKGEDDLLQDEAFEKAVKMMTGIIKTLLTNFVRSKMDLQEVEKVVNRATFIRFLYLSEGPHDVPKESLPAIMVLDENVDYELAIPLIVKRASEGFWEGSGATSSSEGEIVVKWVLTLLPAETGLKFNRSTDPCQITNGSETPTRIHTVNIPGKKFERYVDILSLDELQAGVKNFPSEDVTFIHRNRFLGVIKNFETARIIAINSVISAYEKKGMRVVPCTTDPIHLTT